MTTSRSPQSPQSPSQTSPDQATADVASPLPNGAPATGQNGATTQDETKDSASPAEEANDAAPSKAVNGASSPPVAGGPNGVVQTRKRSRSGTRISRSSPDSPPVRRRGPNDTDGKAFEQYKLEQYLQRDMRHLAASCRDTTTKTEFLQAQRAERITTLRLRNVMVSEEDERTGRRDIMDYPVTNLRDPMAMYGPGYGYYARTANTPPSNQPGIIYPGRRPRPGGRRTPELRVRRRDLQKHADQLEDLVPIRLDIEWQKVRLRDSFTWNLHDRLVPPQLFASQLVEDFGLALDKCEELVRQVYNNMQEQIQDYYPLPFIDDGPEDPHLPYEAYKDDEMRITINLNITIGQHTLIDKFEWDMNNASDAPELFATQMAKDLSLSGDFVTAIAHDIREQCQMFTKSLYIVGHPFDGRPVGDQDLLAAMNPSPLISSFRPYQMAKEYTPYLYELSETDLERAEHTLSREERRQKRSVNRRGGPALPDLKDRRKTIRSLVVSSIIPGAAETLEDSQIFKRVMTTSSGRPKRAGLRDRDEFEESDGSDSDADSSPGSPEIPTYLLSGTARTRSMRGAATAAAQATFKNNATARSSTPDPVLHHHETRTSSRRKDYREDSVEDVQPSLIVKLKISPTKFRHFLRELRSKTRANNSNVVDSPQRRSQSVASNQSTPKPSNMMLPPSTPGQHGSPVIPPSSAPKSVPPLGRVEALTGPPSPNNPPPPPPQWLAQALANLRTQYPDAKFEGIMRYTAFSVSQDAPVAMPPAGSAPNPDIKYYWYPRIKCLDCPGKVYNPGPDATLGNFEIHLRMGLHRERVEERLRREGRTSA